MDSSPAWAHAKLNRLRGTISHPASAPRNRCLKALPDQIRGVQAVLAAHAGPMDAKAFAACFSSARRARVEAILESLAALGQAHEVEEGRWAV